MASPARESRRSPRARAGAPARDYSRTSLPRRLAQARAALRVPGPAARAAGEGPPLQAARGIQPASRPPPSRLAPKVEASGEVAPRPFHGPAPVRRQEAVAAAPRRGLG